MHVSSGSGEAVDGTDLVEVTDPTVGRCTTDPQEEEEEEEEGINPVE